METRVHCGIERSKGKTGPQRKDGRAIGHAESTYLQMTTAGVALENLRRVALSCMTTRKKVMDGLKFTMATMEIVPSTTMAASSLKAL